MRNMNDKRFRLAEDSNGLLSIFDNEDKEDEPLIYGAMFGTDKIVDLLNEQQATINELKAQLREKEEDEKLYANEILELRETNKEHIKFKSLGGNY